MTTFPWPPRELSPNARCDRRAISGIRKRYREAWGWTAIAAGLKAMPAGPLHLSITFHPPSRNMPDLDNCLSSIKSGLDGLADVIRVDDSFWSLTIQRSEPTPGGAVVVQIGAPIDAVSIPVVGTIS